MYVVVIGSREWSGAQAASQVHEVLNELRKTYSGLVIATSSTDKGVRRIR
jgi:hypothetical protein